MICNFSYNYNIFSNNHNYNNLKNNNSNIKIIDINKYMQDKFDEYYSGMEVLQKPNCIYLTLNIYNNVITNKSNYIIDENIHKITSEGKLALVLKIGSTGSNKHCVYDRLKYELTNNESFLFSIPIMIMSGNNVRSIEFDIHYFFHKYKLKIGMIKKQSIYSPREIYEIDDDLKDEIYYYCEDKNLECLYNSGPKNKQTWIDFVPDEIQEILENNFPDKELEILEISDNIDKNDLSCLRQYY